MRWSETKDCVQPKSYLVKIKNRKRHILVFVFRMQILDLLNAIITLLCVTEFVSTENQHNASVLFIMVLAEMSDVFMVLTKHRDPKNTSAHFFHHLCAKYVSKYALQCKNYIKILNLLLCTCIGVHYAMPNSINAIFIWIRLFIYVVDCSFTRIGWIT